MFHLNANRHHSKQKDFPQAKLLRVTVTLLFFCFLKNDKTCTCLQKLPESECECFHSHKPRKPNFKKVSQTPLYSLLLKPFNYLMLRLSFYDADVIFNCTAVLLILEIQFEEST